MIPDYLPVCGKLVTQIPYCGNQINQLPLPTALFYEILCEFRRAEQKRKSKTINFKKEIENLNFILNDVFIISNKQYCLKQVLIKLF